MGPPRTTSAAPVRSTPRRDPRGACPCCRRPGPGERIEGTSYAACPTCGSLRSIADSCDVAGATAIGAARTSDARRARARVGHLRRAVGELRGSRLLELGPRDDLFVRAARDVGIDAVREADASARGTFDVVVAWEGLELLEEPGALLERAASSLGPSGWVVVATPNAESLLRRGLGARWHGYDLPARHRTCLTEAGFRCLAARTGWHDVRAFTVDGGPGGLMQPRAPEAFDLESAVRRGAAWCLAPAGAVLERLTGRVPGALGETLVAAARLR
ncbi:MAG: class I SAM-dependent methyltransferase [Planctomycetota bacterium]